jgi:serine/threonine-protein kinase
VIQRALAKDPNERYPSAGDLGRAAIAAVRGEAPIAAERSVAVGDAAPVPTTIGTVPPPSSEPSTSVLPPSQPSTAPLPSAAPMPLPSAPPTGPSYPGAPPPQHPPGSSRRPVVIASLVVLLALAGAVAALAAAGTFSGDDKKNDDPTTQASSGTASTVSTNLTETTDTTGPEEGISSDQINQVVDAYSAAYTNENPDHLSALLTDDAERTSEVNGDTTGQSGRSEILGEYQRQWDATDTQSYTLSDVVTKNTGDDASVEATYTIRRGSGLDDATGRISLHLVPADGGLLIDRIDAVADSQ